MTKSPKPIWQQTRTALGSEAIITLVGKAGQTEAPTEVFDHYWRLVEAFETRFSRFREDSELTHLNNHAGHSVTVSPEMSAILQACQDLYQQTRGIFNPAVLPALTAAGYDRTFDRIRSSKTGRAPLAEPAPDFAELKIHPRKHTVSLPAGWAIDLGGIGKGYLLDMLADQITSAYPNFWLSFGGDIIAQGANEYGEPWQIGIADATDDRKDHATITLGPKRQAVATSGVVKRQGLHHGRRWHHLIDPRTGQPATTTVATATVTADTATEADVVASCVVITGPTGFKELTMNPSTKLVDVQPRKRSRAPVATAVAASLGLLLLLPHYALAAAGPTLGQTIGDSWPWFITRAAGLTSLVLLILIGISGVLLATGVMYRLLSPISAWAFHRALSLSLIITILLHVLSLLFDHYRPFTLTTILIPFTSTLAPTSLWGINFGSLWVALGILSLYLFIPIILSSLYWVESRQRTWKILHFLSYGMLLAVLIHGLYLGTDSAIPLVRFGYYSMLVLLVIGIAHRLTRVGAVKNGTATRRPKVPQ